MVMAVSVSSLSRGASIRPLPERADGWGWWMCWRRRQFLSPGAALLVVAVRAQATTLPERGGIGQPGGHALGLSRVAAPFPPARQSAAGAAAARRLSPSPQRSGWDWKR